MVRFQVSGVRCQELRSSVQCSGFSVQGSGLLLASDLVSVTRVEHYLGSYHGFSRSFHGKGLGSCCFRELFGALSVVKCIVSFIGGVSAASGQEAASLAEE